MKKAALINLSLGVLLSITSLAATGGSKKPFPGSGDGFNFKKEFNHAKALLDGGDYKKALPVFLDLLKEQPGNNNINFLLGFCLYNIRSKRGQALPYLEKAAQKAIPDYNDDDYKEQNAPVYAFLYLGKTQLFTGKPDEALVSLNKFRSYLVDIDGKLIKPKNLEVFNDVNNNIEQVNIAKTLMAHPKKYNLEEPAGLNETGYSSYGAQLTDGGKVMYFTREKAEPGKEPKAELMMMKKKENVWYGPVFPVESFRSLRNDVFSYISPGGNFFLFSSDRGGDYAVYYSLKEEGKWSLPSDNLHINSSGQETSAVMTKDGRTMFFESDRPGGFGGKDIYFIKKNPDGSWGEPQNLGFTVNTIYDEDTPWPSENGDTLFFSSEGHQSMGGFDVFYTVSKNGIWLEPVNLGYPLNSASDDLYFKTYKETGLATLSSNRSGDRTRFQISILKFPVGE